ncbi:zinc finger protein 23-like [Ischnura elegans]|uniref:zinc finger protein 23-like n=1 Tax=Ischnura elegans TaxID=197161 RepID=UPI001ED894AF|nr:zinc finger protein 23-like [Ischnura elegans]
MDALHDLVGLQVAVGDGLPTTMCPTCLKKLTEFSVFKKICLESNSVLRKLLPRNYCRSIEGEGAANDPLGSSVDTKEGIQGVNESTSELACSVQTTEIYIPVQNCLLSRNDNLMFDMKEENENHLIEESYPVRHTPDHARTSSDVSDPLATDGLFDVKEENEDQLSEGNYTVLYKPDPGGISSDVVDPLASDELIDRETFKCSSVKEDQISDDEDRYVLNDCTDGASSTLMYETSSNQGDPATFKCSSVKEDQISDDEDGCLLNDCTDSASSKLMYQTSSNQPNTLTTSLGEKLEAQVTAAIMADLDWTLIEAKKEPSPMENAQPTLSEDVDPIEISTVAHDSTTEAFGAPAAKGMPIQASSTLYLHAVGNVRNHSTDQYIGPTALVAQIDSGTGASQAGMGRSLMDKDLEKCGALDTDKLCSIHDDGQFNTKHMESLKIRGDRASVTVVGEVDCDAPNTNDNLRLIRISGNVRSGCETVMGDNEEINNCLIKNAGNTSKENSYHCFNCRDGFNNKNELLKHMKSHSIAQNIDAIAESSIGDVSLKTVPSCGFSSFGEPTSSKTLLGLERLEPSQKRKGLPKETGGGKGDKKNVRRVSTSFPVEEKSTSQSLSSEPFCIGNQCNRVGARERGRPYSCSACTKCFTRKGGLVKHIRTHTGERPYSCNVCEKSFVNKGHLVTHARTHTGEKPFRCNICCKSFNHSGLLNSHMGIHTGEKPYSCSECGKSFSGKTHLNRHVRTHSGVKPYSCNECGKSFSSRNHLNRHLMTHTGVKPHSCTVCGKSFAQKGDLNIHIRVHTGEKPYVCATCSKSFAQRNALVAHMRTHSLEKPFSCKICQKCFTGRGNLKKHLLVHSGEKPYACEVCSKSFARTDHLASHMRIHSTERPHSCSICFKSFADSSSLGKHIQTHTTEKPYTCNVCSKTFTRRKYLVRHMSSHRGDRPFSCNDCEKSFSRKDYLVKHFRTHSGEKP